MTAQSSSRVDGRRRGCTCELFQMLRGWCSALITWLLLNSRRCSNALRW